jgi:hypothetical protein
MSAVMRDMAEWAGARLPDRLREGIARGGLSLLGWSGLRKTPVALLRGATRGSRRSGVLLVAGHDPWVGYVSQRFFQDEPVRETVGEFTLSALPHLLDRLCGEADLTVARVDRRSARRWAGLDYLMVPEWVGTRLRVPDDLEQLVRSGGSIKRDMVLVRRHQYQPVVTQGAQDCEAFYDSIYLPFTRHRHGESAFLRSVQDLRRRVDRGGILWVQRGGRRVAAVLYERKAETLDLLALGTVDGDLSLEREGAVAALYYFILKWAREVGCSTVDFRGSRPSLTDGLLRYKSKWGVTLYDKTDSYHDLLLRWRQVNPVVTEFLSHTPLIFRDEGGFSALLGNEQQREGDLWVDGLRRCYHLAEWQRRSTGKEPGTQHMAPLAAGR